MIGAFFALLLGLVAYLLVRRLVFLMDDADLDQEIAAVGGYLANNPQLASELLGATWTASAAAYQKDEWFFAGPEATEWTRGEPPAQRGTRRCFWRAR